MSQLLTNYASFGPCCPYIVSVCPCTPVFVFYMLSMSMLVPFGLYISFSTYLCLHLSLHSTFFFCYCPVPACLYLACLFLIPGWPCLSCTCLGTRHGQAGTNRNKQGQSGTSRNKRGQAETRRDKTRTTRDKQGQEGTRKDKEG